MEQRISLITLGVKDLPKARSFYTGLGWKTAESISDDDICFFQLGAVAIALFPVEHLLEAQKIKEAPRPGGITIAYNARTKEEVHEVIEKAVSLGATLISEVEEYPWGGMGGYFADLDGHSWEVSWMPDFVITEKGEFILEAKK